MKKTTINIVLQEKKCRDGTQNVVLRVIKDRKKKDIRLGINCQSLYFKNQEFTKNFPDYKTCNLLLTKYKTKAYEILRGFELDDYDFSLIEFEQKFFGNEKGSNINLIQLIDKLIEQNINSGRVGNARAYSETKNSLIRFRGKSIVFKDINVEFLCEFESNLRMNGNENGGVAFKMRELRAIFNKAIELGLISQEQYPFKSYKISRLKQKSNKRALANEEFKKLKELDVSKHPHLIHFYNYFMFSFYTRGMNFIDIIKLKWTDIKDNRIYYVRSKTKGTFSIEILEPVQTILDYYKTTNGKSQYVFPILLKSDLTPIQILNRKKKVLQQYNSGLKEIAKLIGINKNLTSYVARHSFATALKNKGSSIEKISELMGHSDIKVTMSYLKDFDQDTLDIENRKLLE